MAYHYYGLIRTNGSICLLCCAIRISAKHLCPSRTMGYSPRVVLMVLAVLDGGVVLTCSWGSAKGAGRFAGSDLHNVLIAV